MAGGLAGRLLGLPGFAVVTVADYGGEIEMMIETTESLSGCPRCGTGGGAARSPAAAGP